MLGDGGGRRPAVLAVQVALGHLYYFHAALRDGDLRAAVDLRLDVRVWEYVADERDRLVALLVPAVSAVAVRDFEVERRVVVHGELLHGEEGSELLDAHKHRGNHTSRITTCSSSARATRAS